MLDFRKWFLALAVVALIAVPASAQPLSCFAQATGTPSIRADGIAELVGDVLIKCDGGTPTAVGQPLPEVNIQIFTTNNINITSKIIVSPFSEALLFVDEPVPGNQVLCGSTRAPNFTGYPGECGITKAATGTPYDNSTASRPNAFQGRQLGANSLLWILPFDPPGTTTSRYLRITNVRVNASQLNVPAGAQAAVGLFISTSPSGLGIGSLLPISLPITNPAPTVAFAQQSHTFAVSGAANFLQCISQNKDFAGDTQGSSPTSQMNLRWTENFPTAFKRRTLAMTTNPSDTSPDPVSQNDFRTATSAASYNTETGFFIRALDDANGWFTSPLMPAGTTGLANSGTRLIARFSNVPNGVTLWVACYGNLVNTLYTTQITGNVRLVTTDPNGAGPFSATPLGSPQQSGIAQVSLIANAGSAVWEILNTDSAVSEQARIPVYVVYVANTTNNLPGLGQASVNGSLAPLSSVMVASATAPVPRFVDLSTAQKLFRIDSCVTNLLFPYVTNRGGFDTGLVISNTSLDPFGTPTQAGACKVYFYGDTAGGGAAPPMQTTTTVNAGTQVIWTLSMGGTNNMTATPGFQGYIIASCAFQFGHGFAFIDDARAEKLAMGYLALVMDAQWTGFPRTGSVSEVLGM